MQFVLGGIGDRYGLHIVTFKGGTRPYKTFVIIISFPTGHRIKTGASSQTVTCCVCAVRNRKPKIIIAHS